MKGPKSLMFLLLLGACGPASIDAACEDIARVQCERCYECESGDASGGELCRLDEETDRRTCESTFTNRCAELASTQENPKSKLSNCDESLETLVCDTLFVAYAQDQRFTTASCDPFL